MRCIMHCLGLQTCGIVHQMQAELCITVEGCLSSVASCWADTGVHLLCLAAEHGVGKCEALEGRAH